ncbi:hypothetical protein BDQ17DRAFT_1289189 [Cyathus striatus]|nr:hypothetical protein BDQ17DRAFT_1289189 [Cyathus striatus]
MRLTAFTSAISIAFLAGVNAVSIERRDGTNSQWTFYNPGSSATACGPVIEGGAFAVAIDPTQYNSGSNCFRTITLKSGGKSTQATVLDECVTCPPGGLDLTVPLFEFFQPISTGIIHGNWSFN